MSRLSSFLKSTIFFFIFLLVFLSLISYNPQDISSISVPRPAQTSNFIGIIGAYLAFGLFFLFGYAAYFIPFYLFFLGWAELEFLRFHGLGRNKIINIVAFIFFVTFLSTFISLFSQQSTQVFRSGGLLGFYLSGLFRRYLGLTGSFITVFLIMAINAILLFGFFFMDLSKVLKRLALSLSTSAKEALINFKEKRSQAKEAAPAAKGKLKNKDPQIKMYQPKANKKEPADHNLRSQEVNKTKEKASSSPKAPSPEGTITDKDSYDPLSYKLPSLDLLKKPPSANYSESKGNIKANIKKLENALLNFGVEAEVVSVQKGPVVTMYELSPRPGTKIQKISSLSDDIALAMKSSLVRIVAPLPGRGTVGIEIPNSHKHLVHLREVLEEKSFIKADSKLTLAIGKDVSGNSIIADLGDMPHLLIAGATGAGKTVCVNSLISSLIYKARPDQLKFILIDPKMVELAPFSGIPHLIHPIISEAKKAFAALNWAVGEMEQRYKKLAKEGSRNIDAYNERASEKMPYIVIVVDELADLMTVARESIETAIQRLAQLSRAVGIHLILATQRPSVDVITGVIKANFPSRISFKVSSRVDSRTVLDSMGAEKLIGKGDLLFLRPGAVKLTRGQGSFIDDQDIGELADFCRNQGAPVYEESITEEEKKQKMNLGSDELFDDAVRLVLQTNQASASLLQRRMRVGYTRAARLLDMMEQKGIVGPFCGSKARDILVEGEKYLAEKGLV
ncbi:MAG: DNA translocase FtsK [Candidatus Omnitrophica bacterium]|nr:DNA translocase FtsK [Candidatus Omnitrophota bacterium]MCF7894878.1 DNA translocase FtsK [Candidatus Omnitrophota bacterium]